MVVEVVMLAEVARFRTQSALSLSHAQKPLDFTSSSTLSLLPLLLHHGSRKAPPGPTRLKVRPALKRYALCCLSECTRGSQTEDP